MADFLVRKEQEKEEERERRAELRDQKKAAQEMAAALEKLRKEQSHYSNLLGKLDPSTDPGAYAQAQAKLAEIGESISGVEQRAANIRTGHVYVISNLGAFGPDMVKIGMTRRLEPMERVVELGDASVPFRFDVHALVFHQDAVSLETHLHQALAGRKVNQMNPRREFFYATPAEVREIIGNYDGSLLVEYRDKAEASEWRNSGAIARDTQRPAGEGDEANDVLADALGSDELKSPGSDLPALLVDVPVEPLSESELDSLGIEADGHVGDELLLADDDSTDEGADTQLATEMEIAVDSTPESGAGTDSGVESPTENSADVDASTGAVPTRPAVPAGWYVNPDDESQWRYWDGEKWTDNVSARV